MSEAKRLHEEILRLESLKRLKPELAAKITATQVSYKKKLDVLTSPVPKGAQDFLAPTASTVNMSGEKTMNHPMGKYVNQQRAMLSNKLASLERQMNKEAALLKQAEGLKSGNIMPGGSAQAAMHNMAQGLEPGMRPGNLGDINKVVWPFWFTTTESILAPNTSVQGNVTVTQEAAFIWLSYTKAVFKEETGGPGQYQFIDPDQAGAAGKSNGLTFLVRDSQSSRSFMNQAVDINEKGHWKYPTVLANPQLILPNSNLEFTYQNNDANNTYKPFVTMFGLRVRIEDAKDILSMVSA